MNTLLKHATVVVGVVLLLTVMPVWAKQLPPEGMMFDTVDEKIIQAKKAKAHLYVPVTFEEGMEYYNEAKQMYHAAEDAVDIKEAVRAAIIKFEKAIEDTEVAAVFFTETMLAREDAIKVAAPDLDPKNWREAEELFRDAAEILEDGDTKDAKKKAKQSEKRFREAELAAIQGKYLKTAWSHLNRADNMGVPEYAPETFTKARELAKKSAALLHLHRYDQTEAAQLAAQAEYEINHAIYLAIKIKQLKDADRSVEAVLLSVEEPIKKIAATVDLAVQFDEGMDVPTQHIVVAIEKLQQENLLQSGTIEKNKAEYTKALVAKDSEISLLQEQIIAMRHQLTQLADTKELLKMKVEQERIRKEKIARISSSLDPSEGKALLDGENVLIRLYGLNFPSGKSVIEPRYFSLLSKVKKSFSEFPGCNIIIEGHTDSLGSDALNQTLSEERAEAVRQYVIANSAIPPNRIQAIGYGETRPVASNENAAGQAKNRRIDVVIQPMY